MAASGGSEAEADPPTGKTVVFIRHAESKWNRAMRTRNLVALSRSRDAPLTSRGYEQSAALQDGLRVALYGAKAKGSSVLEDLAAAEQIWVSPLTRSLQTALVALLPLFEGVAQPSVQPMLTLKPGARERKTAGWDSLGVARGPRCRARAVSKLRALAGAGPPEEQLARMSTIPCDSCEVEHRWWTRTFESRGRVRRRAAALLDAASLSDAAVLVVVSHSNFLREVFRQHLEVDQLRSGDAPLAEGLRRRKLPNCAVASCALVTRASGVARLESVRCCMPNGEPLPAERFAVGSVASRSRDRGKRSAKVHPL
jgi:broad specificity phosphatase PhoE